MVNGHYKSLQLLATIRNITNLRLLNLKIFLGRFESQKIIKIIKSAISPKLKRDNFLRQINLICPDLMCCGSVL